MKVVSDFVYNYERGLPSEMAILTLFDPETGMPRAILDAGGITDMRTGAVTAIGAKYLARKGSKVLGHIGARGTAYWNVRLLDSLFDFDEIRVHSKRPESQRRLCADGSSRTWASPWSSARNWQDVIVGADIVVEASRLLRPEPLLRTEWIKPGALVMPYGTMSALELSLTDIMAKLVVDDWGQVGAGQYGALRAARRRRQADREHAARRDGRDRRRAEAGAGDGRGDHPVLASRPVARPTSRSATPCWRRAPRLGIGQRLRFA